MKAWLANHRRALTLASRRLAASPLGSLLSALAIGIALALPAAGELLLANASAQFAGLPLANRISVFMTTAAERRAALATAEQIRRHPAVKSVQLVGREDTLARMRADANLAEAIDMLPGNPFPDALVVESRDAAPQAMESLAGDLRGQAQVEHVALDAAWVRQLDAAMRLVRTLVAAVAVVLGLGVVAIAFNTIRLQVLDGRSEIELSRLLGATPGQIGRPFQYFGLLQGIAGGGVAWLFALALAAWLRTPVADLATAYGVAIELKPLSPADSAILLGAAGLLGWLGATLSVRQHLDAA